MKSRKFDKYTIISLSLLGLIVLAIVFYEVDQSRRELLDAQVSEAGTLIDAIGSSIENNTKSSRLIDEFLIEKLNVFSAMAGHLVTDMKHKKQEVSELMNEFDIDYLSLVDYHGNIVFTSTGNPGAIINASDEIFDELQIMIDEDYLWYELGNIFVPAENREMFMFARNLGKPQLIVLSGIDNRRLLEFRKQAGIGRLIKDFSANKDIIFLAIQDSTGIYAASPGLDSISSIIEDTFLSKAMINKEFIWRIADYGNKKVLEGAKSLKSSGDSQDYIIRLALSVDKIRAIQQGAMIRAILMGIGIFLTGGIIIVLLNIRTRLGKLKLEHRRMLQYTSHILGNITNAVIAVERTGSVAAFNDYSCKIFGIEPKDVLGRKYSEVFPGDEPGLLNYIKGRAPVSSFGIKLKSKTGEERILEEYISVVRDEKGDVEFIISIFIDLTEKVRTEEALRRKDKLTAMGELAGGVAHEIRNPLNSISVISQRFELEFEPKADAGEYYKLAGIIKSETARINNIIRQFLEFARPPKLNLAEGDLAKTVFDTISLIEGDAKEKNIEINISASGSIAAVYDKEKIRQALLNLFKNALDAMTSGGILSVAIGQMAENAEITISDTGCGIAEEAMSKIFNLYFTTKDAGSGIGLSIVNQIVSEHGGQIFVHSKVGEGSKFVISLPVNKSE